MQPVLFTIGPYNVYSFGFFLALAFLLSTFVIWKYARDEFKEEEYLDIYVSTSIAALISARLFYILLHFSEFGTNILRYIVVRQTPGLSLLGGMIGGFLYLALWGRKKKKQIIHLLDLFSVAASVSLVLAKIGEQLGGAGFGKATTGPLAVQLVGLTGRFHPVELYEAVLFLILSVVLFILYEKTRRKKLPKGTVVSVFAVTVACIIFSLEFLKAYPVYLYGLSRRQIGILLIVPFLMVPLGQRLYVLISKGRNA